MASRKKSIHHYTVLGGCLGAVGFLVLVFLGAVIADNFGWIVASLF